jgi:hypothetical protein
MTEVAHFGQCYDGDDEATEPWEALALPGEGEAWEGEGEEEGSQGRWADEGILAEAASVWWGAML